MQKSEGLKKDQEWNRAGKGESGLCDLPFHAPAKRRLLIKPPPDQLCSPPQEDASLPAAPSAPAPFCTAHRQLCCAFWGRKPISSPRMSLKNRFRVKKQLPRETSAAHSWGSHWLATGRKLSDAGPSRELPGPPCGRDTSSEDAPLSKASSSEPGCCRERRLPWAIQPQAAIPPGRRLPAGQAASLAGARGRRSISAL